ncbi:MAG: adenosylhomocysteinase [Candidatus Eremiobacteraeota bacterium]|nr:adenosylhomocysteinase [Candidatus Eremiobacteraeota bacterium]
MEAPFEQRLQWCRQHFRRARQALDALPELDGVRLAFSVHLDLKMVPFFEALVAKGAELYLTSCNPVTSDPESLVHLSGACVQVDVDGGSQQRALAWQPTHLCELGGALTEALVKRPGGSGVLGSMEGTGSGIALLEGFDLPYPIIDWDQVELKRGLHNRYMVGLTAWHTFFSRTGLTLHGLRVAVLGFGPVGRGVAEAARAYGGIIEILEPEPRRALEASFAGWKVGQPSATLAEADVVVTATGRPGVLREQELCALKDGCFLLNVGHSSDEIDVAAMDRFEHQQVLPHIQAYRIRGKTLYLLAKGSMVNLTAGFGDSLNSFDITLAIMANTLDYLIREGERLPPGLHRAPDRAV